MKTISRTTLTKRRLATADPSRPAAGDRTREQLLEAAGQVFAARGYDAATSKEICERAKVNTAAVNYHFGGIDALYVEVLMLAHRRVTDADELKALAASEIDPKDKLRSFLRSAVGQLLEHEGAWELRLLGREMMAPSKARDAFAEARITPELQPLREIIAQLIGAKAKDAIVGRALFTALSPCMMLVIANRETIKRLMPTIERAAEGKALLDHIEHFVLAGLAATAAS